MPGDPIYTCHLSSEAVSTVLSLTKRKQRKALDIADRIAESPFQISDYQITDSDGHIIENLLVDEFHFTFWIDHGSKEVRITEIVHV